MRYYVVDAFTEKLFSGNPAGVCVVDFWPEDELMQQIAAENNLSETAFVVKRDGGGYDLRWFTPAVEIELCGHATLGTAFILFGHYEQGADRLDFHTLSGLLSVSRRGELLEMDFPRRGQSATAVTDIMRKAARGTPIVGAYGGYNLTLELQSERAVKNLEPDFQAMRELPEYHGVIVTAKGENCDFVSRFFAPNAGVNEDPVTGSTHTSLVPFWAERLKKTELTARQLSRRGGTLFCRAAGERVFIAGRVQMYLVGKIQLADR